VGAVKFPLQLLHEGSDVEGLHVGELADAFSPRTRLQAARGIQVCLARVVVVDLGGEEFQNALRSLGRWREKRGGLKRRGGGEDDFRRHSTTLS